MQIGEAHGDRREEILGRGVGLLKPKECSDISEVAGCKCKGVYLICCSTLEL